VDESNLPFIEKKIFKGKKPPLLQMIGGKKKPPLFKKVMMTGKKPSLVQKRMYDPKTGNIIERFEDDDSAFEKMREDRGEAAEGCSKRVDGNKCSLKNNETCWYVGACPQGRWSGRTIYWDKVKELKGE